MSIVEKDRKAYHVAKDYLLGLKIQGVTEELLDKYLYFSSNQPKCHSLHEIYHRILESAQEASMKTGVIGNSIGGVKNPWEDPE